MFTVNRVIPHCKRVTRSTLKSIIEPLSPENEETVSQVDSEVRSSLIKRIHLNGLERHPLSKDCLSNPLGRLCQLGILRIFF